MALAGCNPSPREPQGREGREGKPFTTHTLSGEQCYEVLFDKATAPWGEDFSVKVSYSLAWPDEGLLSPEAERELLRLCFVDSLSADFATAARKWLSTPFFYEEEFDCERKAVESIDTGRDFSYMHLESTCEEDSLLALFTIRTESFGVGAAHGMYAVDYLTILKASGDALHLADLVSDTNLLCEAIARAIQDLDVNSETRECLFPEFRDAERMPMPSNFLIDPLRNHITVSYSLYEIAPYACGIQSVVLPIFWLSKHVPLSPCAKRLFGPGSYIVEEQ